MSTPRLIRREDIWNNFPVNAKQIGRGENGADRHGIEWHNAKLRALSNETGKPIDVLKREVEPRLLKALHASKSWTVEIPGGAGSPYIAIIAMKFQTRRANNANKGMNTRRWAKSNSPKATPAVVANNRTHRKKAKKPKKEENVYLPSLEFGTRYAPRRVGANVTDIVREGRGLIQKTTKENVDKIVPKFVELVPENKADSKELMEMVYALAVDQQFFHPVTMKFIRGMDAQHAETEQYHKKPSKVIAKMAYNTALEGATFVPIMIKGNNNNLTNSNNVRINKGKVAFRSNLLFLGYMYHQGMLDFKKLKKVLKYYVNDFDADDYRQQDAAMEAVMYILVRAGKAMSEDEDASGLLESVLEKLGATIAEVPRVRMKVMYDKFMDAVKHEYRMEADVPWAIGAPEEGVRPKSANKTRRAPKEALSEDIGELWRRFPLAVKQESGMYVVQFHGVKLKDRFSKESSKYKSIGDLQADIEAHVMRLIKNSDHWKVGPPVKGAFVTVVPK